MQSFITIGIKLVKELRSQEVPTVYVLKMTKFTMYRKKVIEIIK